MGFNCVSCDCFENMRKEKSELLNEFEEHPVEVKLQIAENEYSPVNRIFVYLNIYESYGSYSETLVTSATYCPFCGKKIEIEVDDEI